MLANTMSLRKEMFKIAIIVESCWKIETTLNGIAHTLNKDRKRRQEMDVSLRVLTKEDLPQLQVLLEKCSDYLTFQDEVPVKPSAAQDLFNVKPDGVPDKDKVIFGIFNIQSQLVGVFDLIKGYSAPKTLSLGLMMLEPFSRGKGIGNKAYEALEQWAMSEQFNKVRLGALIGNEKGLRFWHRMDYIETGEVKTQIRPNLSKKVIVLEKCI